MRKGFLILILPFAVAVILPISHAPAAGTISNELERVKGFDEYQSFLRKFEQERERGAKEITDFRLEWDKKIEAAIPAHKASKVEQVESLTEASPEYFQDIKAKENEEKELGLEGERYSAQKKREEGNYVTLLPENIEYGLVPEPERVDWRKRSLYSGSAGAAGATAGGGRSGRGAGNPGFPRPTDAYSGPEGTDFTAPPPPPPTQSGFDSGGSGPDFFEPDIPPPPPPEGGYDDDIPPPIFDEPEY